MYKLFVDNYRLEIWETSKTHQPGYFRWSVSVYHADDDIWQMIDTSWKLSTTLDVALQQCFSAYFDHLPTIPLEHQCVWRVASVGVNQDKTEYKVWLMCRHNKNEGITFKRNEDNHERQNQAFSGDSR